MKKDEAITRTFKQIAANFQQVFSELVCGCCVRHVCTQLSFMV